MLRTLITLFAVLFAACVGLSSAASAQSGYKIKPGDTLQVEVVEDNSLNRSVLVLPDGSISFPYSGTLRASGLSTAQVASALANGMASNFAAKPNVYVSVASLATVVPSSAVAPATHDIFISGEINSPGKIETVNRLTILQAIAQAGGLTRFAAGKRIQLRRENKIYLYNYFTNGGSGSISGNTQLAPGDVIIIPQRKLFE